MSSVDVDPSPASEPSGAGETSRSTPAGARVLGIALAAAVVAGVASWGLGEQAAGRFRPPISAPVAGFPTPEQAAATKAGFQRGEAVESAVAFGIMGALLGCCLGAAGGLALGAGRPALKAAIGGAVVGALVGSSAGWFVTPLYFQYNKAEGDDLLQAILTQCGIVAPLGAVGGAAFGKGFGGRPAALQAILGGVVGAVVGALVFQLVGAIALPLDGASKPLSDTSVSRLAARLVVAIPIALGAARAVLQEPAAAKQSSEGERGA